ncbi:MAG: hypothetical protein ABI637_00340 [Gemmatimonadota bacterium]
MTTRFEYSLASLAAGLTAAALLASCTADPPTATDARGGLGADRSAGTVAVCHKPGSDGAILQVGAPALAAHLAHGDYAATLLVSHEPGQPTDGLHFGSISGALSAARAGRIARGELLKAACRITIAVSADAYEEPFPLVVDVPDLTLQGALRMGLDASGRATGTGDGSGATILTPATPLSFVDGLSMPMIVANAHPGGSAGNGLVVEGFVFRSGHDPASDAGGQGVLGVRATGLIIRGNRFEGGFTESIDLRAGGGDVLENHLAGTAGTCDVCLAGPGTYRASGNRLLAGGIPGIVTSGFVNLPVPDGVEALAIPATAETWAEIRNNEVRDHLRMPVGVGIRVDAVGVNAPNVHNTVHAVIRDNLIANSRFGFIVHAAFPKRGTDLKGDVDVTFGGNVIEHICQAKLLVSFSRHTTALGLSVQPYLRTSTFQLALNGDLSWDDAWFSHPAGFGNTLIVDGQEIANGARQFYDATRCPGI